MARQTAKQPARKAGARHTPGGGVGVSSRGNASRIATLGAPSWDGAWGGRQDDMEEHVADDSNHIVFELQGLDTGGQSPRNAVEEVRVKREDVSASARFFSLWHTTTEVSEGTCTPMLHHIMYSLPLQLRLKYARSRRKCGCSSPAFECTYARGTS